MSKSLKFAEGVRLGLDSLMQPIALLGNKGSGKTYGGLKLFELAHEAGVQCIWLDPVGKAWGLRVGADGRPAGGLKNVYIFGGRRGDFPLLGDKGAFVAKVLFEKRISAVLDVSLLRKGERKRFITDLLEEFYHLSKDQDSNYPVVFFLEEAHTVIPQRPMKGDERMVGAVEDVVLLGRNAGLGCVLMDQRPAHVNKSVLAEVEVLCALRTTYPIDRKVYRDWISDKGAEAIDFDVELPGLGKGVGYLWAPTEGIFCKTKILSRVTFDSSETVRVGGRRRKAGKLGSVDTKEISVAMAVVTEAQASSDPKALKAQIAKLQAQIATQAKTAQPPRPRGRPPGPAKPPKALLRRLEKHGKQAQAISNELKALGEKIYAGLAEINTAHVGFHEAAVEIRKAALGALPPKPMPDGRYVATAHVEGYGTHTKILENKNGKVTEISGSWSKQDLRGKAYSLAEKAPEKSLPIKVGKGELILLTAVAQHTAGISRNHLSVLTGYKRSTRDAYLQRLCGAGLIEERHEAFHATALGISSLGPEYTPLPTGEALRAHWLRELPKGEQQIFERLVAVFPGGFARDHLSEVTGYKRSTRDAYIQRLIARRLVVDGSGGVVASAELFV